MIFILANFSRSVVEVEPPRSHFTFQKLLEAYCACRRRKRKTANAAKIELNFERELLKLERELQERTYKPGQSICFVVTKPKPREIFAADFRDRIVHHLLVRYLEPIFEKKFIFHSFACRKNKGSHCAIKFLKKFLRSATKNFSLPAHYLQVDISAFFMSLNKNILFENIKKYVKNPEILWLAETIIFHDPTDNFYRKGNHNLAKLIPKNKTLFGVPASQGLPIGNLTSQFFANVYLNELDQFIKHELKARYYLRYVDDLVLIHKNPEQLKIWKKEISRFLSSELKLILHPGKSVQQSVYKGINFVGFIVKPGYSLIRRRVANNLKEKLKKFNSLPVPASPELFERDLQNILAVINSYCGQFRHADTLRLRKSICVKHFGILKSYFEPANADFLSFRMKNSLKKTLRSQHFIVEVEPPRST